jgi:hypothetical protein
MVLQNGERMKNEKSIRLGDLKSIFLSESIGKDRVLMVLYTDSAYVHIKLTQEQLDEFIESLKSFQKETA